VVVITPPPPSAFDLGICWQRRAEGVPIAGQYRNCLFRQDNYTRSAQQFDAMMTGFEQRADVPLIRLEQALCRDGHCQIAVDRKPLFADIGHFTGWGSLVVG